MPGAEALRRAGHKPPHLQSAPSGALSVAKHSFDSSERAMHAILWNRGITGVSERHQRASECIEHGLARVHVIAEGVGLSSDIWL